jgi:hypothetical protein
VIHEGFTDPGPVHVQDGIADVDSLAPDGDHSLDRCVTVLGTLKDHEPPGGESIRWWRGLQQKNYASAKNCRFHAVGRNDQRFDNPQTQP